MLILELPSLQSVLRYLDIVNLMRDALIAQFRGQCDTPMPMHLHPDGDGEVHTLSVFHTESDEFQWDADEWFDSIPAVDTDVIEELGERARASYAFVYTVKSGRGLGAVVTGDRVDDERSRRHATEMLRIAITRL